MTSHEFACALRPSVRRPDPDETPLSDDEVIVLVTCVLGEGGEVAPRSLEPARVRAGVANERNGTLLASNAKVDTYPAPRFDRG